MYDVVFLSYLKKWHRFPIRGVTIAEAEILHWPLVVFSSCVHIRPTNVMSPPVHWNWLCILLKTGQFSSVHAHQYILSIRVKLNF
jgi:hypothetical protein